MLAETDDGNEKIQTSNICSVKTGYLELSFITLFIHSHTYFSLISYKYTDILWFLKLENNFLLQSIPEVMLKKGEGSFINQLECVHCTASWEGKWTTKQIHITLSDLCPLTPRFVLQIGHRWTLVKSEK